MREWNVRQGATGGLIVGLITAASASGRSADPVGTFAVFFGVALGVVGLATAAGVVLNRRAKEPESHW
jgi:uncharacterized YccA/Bax inhibitor family protein